MGRGSDHPRACGEHNGKFSRPDIRNGSSPRLRGTPVQIVAHLLSLRIIPAPAGNTSLSQYEMMIMPDHPRACGEHQYLGTPLGWPHGSSPRLRGTHGVHLDGGGVLRIIPAPAGNTAAPPARRGRRPDHPRACGEHHCTPYGLKNDFGSSPRLRGTHRLRATLAAVQRIIPAPAGNTSASAFTVLSCSDHPRACGEHARAAGYDVPEDGSSPRLRGTLPASKVQIFPPRIIPAPAGNTA